MVQEMLSPPGRIHAPDGSAAHRIPYDTHADLAVSAPTSTGSLYQVPAIDEGLLSEPSAATVAASVTAVTVPLDIPVPIRIPTQNLSTALPKPPQAQSGVSSMLVPQVDFEWYTALSPTCTRLLHDALKADVSALLRVHAHQIHIACAQPNPKGVLLSLRFGEEQMLRHHFNAMVAKGLLRLDQTTRCLQELGWFATETIRPEEMNDLKREKLQLEFAAALEDKHLERCRELAGRLQTEHPYEGLRLVCDELHKTFPQCSVQEISVRWGEMMVEWCTVKKGARIREHAVMAGLDDVLGASQEAAAVIEGQLAASKEKLAALIEIDPSPVSPVSCSDVTIFQGVHGKVMAHRTLTQSPLRTHNTFATSLPPHPSDPYSCSLHNDVPPFIDYASL